MGFYTIVLFFIPLFKELVEWSGCVDASKKTAVYNLDKGRTLHIYVGGEKEQMMCKPGETKVYLNKRKGFIKLALKYGTPLGKFFFVFLFLKLMFYT